MPEAPHSHTPLMGRLLVGRDGVEVTAAERQLLEDAISEVRHIGPRETVIEAGEDVYFSTMLVEGVMSRYISDRKGLRQLVAVHFSGEFVDLHAYPMHHLDHSIATVTACKVALVPHAALRAILDPRPDLARKLWFSTLLDAALHRTWLFRVGRLDAVGRVAHFLCETHERLSAVGLAQSGGFVLDLTQADIAEVCGLTAVHTNRAIRQLREAGLVSIQNAQVTVMDRAGLIKRADFSANYLYLART